MTIHVFDFDGVICHQMSEAIYRLAPYEEEKPFVDAVTADGSLSVYASKQYQRHVVWEYYNWQKMKELQVGPYCNFARETEKKYILTARSSTHAIARASSFLIQQQIRPLECFFVGSVGKMAHLSWIADQNPDEQIIFMDDTQHHIDAANSLQKNNLVNILVPDSVHPHEAQSFYESCWR